MLPTVMDIFGHVGDVMELPERLFDAATALHGSGPAYVALFADALIQAGVRGGIPRGVAGGLVNGAIGGEGAMVQKRGAYQIPEDRQSRRLNSRHAQYPYARLLL